MHRAEIGALMNRREQRKRDGLCIDCGEKLEEHCEFIRCEKCRAIRAKKQHEEVAWRKEHGFCVTCGRNKAKRGRAMCQDCTDKTVERNKRYKQYHNSTVFRNKRKANHLCARCGKPLGYDKHIHCEVCRRKNMMANRRHEERKNGGIPIIPRQERASYGLCYICGDKIEFSDDSLCEKCRARTMENLKKAWSSKRSKENRDKIRREIGSCFEGE